MTQFTSKFALLAATSVFSFGQALPAAAEECEGVNREQIVGDLPDECRIDSEHLVVTMPIGENTEMDEGLPQNDQGFVISIDGAPQTRDKRVEDLIRHADKALARADIKVQYDGLGAKTRLDANILNSRPRYKAGDRVSVQSHMNYPSFVERGEIRVIDLAAKGGQKTVATVPIAPNGQASFEVPQGQNLVIVHRVYDKHGRYDETGAIPLSQTVDRGLSDGVEDGSDATARRRIPVHGGMVTVSGQNVRPGARVQTLGETVPTDPNGAFVLQRILPSGEHGVAVQVLGAGENLQIEREVEIPKSDWFYVASADLTFGKRLGQRPAGQAATYNHGRLAFYAKGKTARGWTITSSVDTNEEPLGDLFKNFDRKNPTGLLSRLNSDHAYPVYGDDSSIVDDAPSSGKVYLKAEKNGNHIMWGNYKSTISGSRLLRNERSLYGAQAVYESPEQTSRGQARFGVEAYAAQPDNLPGRDIFRGTGGTVYFLSEQDLSIGSETLTVETRDPDTGRVLNRRTLVQGKDYAVNYIQGIITLNAPLSGRASDGHLVRDVSSQHRVNLVAQYEYTPVGVKVNGLSYGGRIEGWATDKLRIGATGLVESTGIADQTAVGADLRYELNENTYAEAEYARTRGPGFNSTSSNDGGLVIRTNPNSNGTGEAWSFRARADLKDLGSQADGYVSAYAERRTAGFSTLDHQTTVNEVLWGFKAEVETSDRLSWGIYYDDFKDANGKALQKGGVQAKFASSERLSWSLGVEHLNKVTPGNAGETGERTDIALRADIKSSDDLSYYLFGQMTANHKGGLSKNNRIGAGINYAFNDRWSFAGEISDGTLGLSGDAKFTYSKGNGNSAYFGYSLAPDNALASTNGRGQYVAGGKRRINENTDIFADTTYDLFGQNRSLTSAYGVSYRHSEFLSYSGAIELGQVKDISTNTNFERRALSLGVSYRDKEGLDARGRLELRRDAGTDMGLSKSSNTIVASAVGRYKIDEEKRLLFSADYVRTDAAGASLAEGTYGKVTLGYAYRPILNDKLNLLFKYTGLHDKYGQDVNGVDPGAVQESHVLSLDTSYDLNEHWTLGAKVGARWGRSAPDTTTPLTRNDAFLGVVNLQYHLTHEWDLLLEGRVLKAKQAGTTHKGVLATVYRHVGNNMKIGVGYNFGTFSDDLTDLSHNDRGMFVNLVAKF